MLFLLMNSYSDDIIKSYITTSIYYIGNYIVFVFLQGFPLCGEGQRFTVTRKLRIYA